MFFAKVCSIDMAVGTLDLTTVNLVPNHLSMIQAVNMPIFQITDWKFESRHFVENKTGISMVIVMKRKIMSEMMTTYFPSLLLMLITFATTFFKPFFFEAALSVNLTTMLVMTTIFISKMEGLPPTSATKMIDYWLILCQLVPFAQVVLLTAIEYLKEDHLEDEEATVDFNDTKEFIIPLGSENEEGVQLETKEAGNDTKEKENKFNVVLLLVTMGKFYILNI